MTFVVTRIRTELGYRWSPGFSSTNTTTTEDQGHHHQHRRHHHHRCNDYDRLLSHHPAATFLNIRHHESESKATASKLKSIKRSASVMSLVTPNGCREIFATPRWHCEVGWCRIKQQ